MKKLLLASLALVGMTTVAQAADPAFRIAHGGLRYHIGNKEKKVDDADAVKSGMSGLQTLYGNWEIAAFHDGWAFYATPAQSGGYVAVGKEVAPGIEVGLGLNLETSTVKVNDDDSFSTSDMAFMPYLTHTMDMGSMVLESTLGISYMTGSTTDTADGAAFTKDAKTKTSGFGFSLKTGPYWTIGKNFEIGAGIGFGYKSSEETETKTKITETNIDVVLQEWRYKF